MRSYVKNKILKIVNNLELNPETFRHFFKNPNKDFTRNRKQSFSDIVKIGLLSSGSCMKEELRKYHGLGSDRPSPSAYIQQRDKLTVDCYNSLFNHFLELNTPFTLIKNKYLLVACDGSDINLCPSEKDESTKLNSTNNPNNKVCNQIHLNALSVVPDGYFIDYVIQDNVDKNEDLACAQMMENLSAKNLKQKIIITCDRGYESYYLMMLAQSLGFYFCIRAKDIYSNGISSRYKDLIDENGNLDEIIKKKYSRCIAVSHNKTLYPDYIYIPPSVNNSFIPKTNNKAGRNKTIEVSYYSFSFRLVRFDLGGGNYETLLTNLPQGEFSLEELKQLYHLRWGIETAFRFLKYDDYLSFSNTKKKVTAIGEIIFSMIFHNICISVLIAFNEKHLRKLSSRKYLYKVSYSDLSKSLRLYIAGRDPTINVNKIVKELLMTIQPIRNERIFSRILNKRSFVPFIYRAS